MESIYTGKGVKREWVPRPNAPSDLSLLAFGIPPSREAELAGGMPKVPKGKGLGRLACSQYFLMLAEISTQEPLK